MPSPWKKSLDARKQPPAQLSRAGRHSQYTSLWFCCECCGSGRPASGGGMTTEIMHCPDSECTHLRCPECSLESNKQKEPKIGCSIDSGLLPNRLSKSRLSNEVTETETPENFKGSLSTTAELQKTQPLHQRRRRPKYKQKNTVPRPKCSKTNAPQVPSQREVFACPFHKKDPHLYNQFVNSHYLVCTQAGWSEIRRLINEHLDPVHRVQMCDDCGTKHTRIELCNQGPESRDLVLDEEKWEEILVLRSSKKIVPHGKWQGIWCTLFPQVKPPSDPKNENPWAHGGSFAHEVAIRSSETPYLTPFTQEHLNEDSINWQLSLTGPAQLTKKLSYDSEPSHDSFNPTTWPAKVTYVVKMPTAPSETIETLVSCDSTSFWRNDPQWTKDLSKGWDFSSQQRYICYPHAPSDGHTNFKANQACSSHPPESFTTISNPSTALTIPTPIPPLPLSVLLGAASSYDQDLVGETAIDLIDRPLDQEPLHTLFDDNYFRTPSMSLKLDENQSENHQPLWDTSEFEDNEVGNLGFDISPNTDDLIAVLESDNEMPQAHGPLKTKNDGNLILRNRKRTR